MQTPRIDAASEAVDRARENIEAGELWDALTELEEAKQHLAFLREREQRRKRLAMGEHVGEGE